MKEKSPGKPGVRHETRDIDVRGIAWFAVGLVMTIAAIFFAVRGLFGLFGERKHVGRKHESAPKILPSEPRLQSDPTSDLARLRERETNILNSYGWVDRDTGVARIPIERAMNLIAQRGLPAPELSSGKTPLQMRREKANVEKPTP